MGGVVEYLAHGSERARSGLLLAERDHAWAGHGGFDGNGVADFGSRSYLEDLPRFVTPDRVDYDNGALREDDGRVWLERHAHPRLQTVSRRVSKRAFPEFRLTASPVDEEARRAMGFKWADPEVGNRHKIGGAPGFQQPVEAPRCPSCGEEMTFYAQLDSIGDAMCLADCGMIYVFVCLDCYTTTSFLQSA